MTAIPTIRQALQLAVKDAARMDKPFEADYTAAYGNGELLGKDGTPLYPFEFRLEWNYIFEMVFIAPLNCWSVDKTKPHYVPKVAWISLNGLNWEDNRITNRSLDESKALPQDAPLADVQHGPLLKQGFARVLDDVLDKQLVLNVVPSDKSRK